MTLVAGVDSSTQSTKVEVRDLESGAVVGSGTAPHPATTPPCSEQDPLAWKGAFDQAWAAAGAPAVAAISIAGQQHGMVVLDEAGEVLRPAKLWNDTQSAPDADWLVGKLGGGAAWADRVGSVPVASFTVTKLSWLHRSEPEVWSRMARVLLPHDWLTWKLSGAFVTDRGDASGTGYWRPEAGEYAWDVLRLVDGDRDWSPALPRVAAPREAVGSWGSAAVACGTGDNMGAALGLGLRAGTAVVSLGTSGTAFTVSTTATHDPTGAVAGFADASGNYLPLVCTLNATKVTDAVGRLLGADHDELARLALAEPVGAGGVTLLPYLDGERTPNRPDATGWLSGLRSDVSRGQLARAAFEGVACGLLDALDALRAHARVNEVVLVGGGSRSAAYQQVFAQLCDLPVSVADANDAVVTGACVQAAAVASGETHAEVAARWKLGGREPIAATTNPAAGDVRARYAGVRDRAVG